MERDIIHIPEILLEWSSWTPWMDLMTDARTGVGIRIPNNSGVYEARLVGSLERLTIGRASNLRMRVKQSLVKGNAPHSAGQKMRANENVKQIVVRWAVTDRPAAAEEELHRRHQDQFGQYPKYTDHT
jgi:excinuclease UvrABC nuclease subunit